MKKVKKVEVLLFSYDPSSPASIEEYAKQLLNNSLRDVLGDIEPNVQAGKGEFGDLVQSAFFGIAPNSRSEPDFAEAGIELKTSPLKKVGTRYKAKERLVLNLIDYNLESGLAFEESSFWKKNACLLLMFYVWDTDIDQLDQVFKVIRLWQYPPHDLAIIEQDWTRIMAKIKAGKAHEISEGDTLYLAACTKGQNKGSLRSQPFSTEKAKQRAFSLKQGYLDYIIYSSLHDIKSKVAPEPVKPTQPPGQKGVYPMSIIRNDPRINSEPVVRSASEYEGGKTFEDHVLGLFDPFMGWSENMLLEHFKVGGNSKQKFYLIAKGILGVSKKRIEEFDKAGVTLKTIRVEPNGEVRESMSFKNIDYKSIVYEDWEDSEWHSIVTGRFLFIVFKKNDPGGLYRLRGAFFWTMPASDLPFAKAFWKDTRDKVRKGIQGNFIQAADAMVCHVRPKARKGDDMTTDIEGRPVKKLCYWLNRDYIMKILKENGVLLLR